MAASGRTGPSQASLAAPRAAFGNSRGRAVIGRPGLGDLPGREVSWSFAPEELRALRDPAFETRAPEPEGERACLEPSPRLLGLYLTSSTGTPVVRVERPGISEDPASVSAVLGVVADLVRDAFSPGGALPDGGILRAATGKRGFCGVRNRGFGLVAAIEGAIWGGTDRVVPGIKDWILPPPEMKKGTPALAPPSAQPAVAGW